MSNENEKTTDQMRNGFYGEIDSLRLKSSCSLFSVVALLIIIFIILVAILIYLNTSRKISINFSGLIPNIKVLSVRESQEEEQFTSITRGNEIIINLTEKQLSQLVGVDKVNFPLKKASLRVQKDRMIVSGKTSNSILAIRVDCALLPKVEDNKITFDVKDIKSGNVSAPKYIVDQVKSKFDFSINIPPQYKIDLKEIKLFDGYAELIGIPKS